MFKREKLWIYYFQDKPYRRQYRDTYSLLRNDLDLLLNTAVKVTTPHVTIRRDQICYGGASGSLSC